MTTRTNISVPYAAVATNWWIRIKPKSLRVRLAWLAALLLCLIQLVLSIVFYHFTAAWLLAELDQTLMTTGAQVAASFHNGEPLDKEDFRFRLDEGSSATATFLRTQQFFIRVIDRNSGLILGESATYNIPVSAQARNDKANIETFYVSSLNAPMQVYTLPLEDHSPFALQIGQSIEEVLETENQITRLLGVMLFATAVLALGSGWFIANRALKPILSITRTAQHISEHALNRRIDNILSDDELGQLTYTFNNMLDRLEGAFQRQRQFTADAAHELRTPLAILQTGLDVTLSQTRSASVYRTTLETMGEEIQRLSQLTTQLLTLARTDSHELTIERHPMDLSLLLNTVADQLEISAQQKQIAIARSIPPNVIIKGDESGLIQLALNLLGNAVKYTPAGGSITVKLTLTSGQVCLTIMDTGVGISAEHLAHIFDRFYRIDHARTREQGGFGLGLAIAQHIAQLHGGRIAVTSQPDLGSEFVVSLPVS